MSEQVVPRRSLISDDLKVTPVANSLVIECEAVRPKSRKGKTVYLYLDPDTITKLLIELRKSAIEARR